MRRRSLFSFLCRIVTRAHAHAHTHTHARAVDSLAELEIPFFSIFSYFTLSNASIRIHTHTHTRAPSACANAHSACAAVLCFLFSVALSRAPMRTHTHIHTRARHLICARTRVVGAPAIVPRPRGPCGVWLCGCFRSVV